MTQFDFTPLSDLTSFTNKRVNILIRVSEKHALRAITSSQKPNSVFSFHGKDSQGTEIKVTSFGADADRFCNLIEEDQVYRLTNPRVKMADPRYNTTGHDYEITTTGQTVIESFSGPPADDIPSVSSSSTTPLADLPTITTGDLVDVLVVIKSKDLPSEVMSQKYGKAVQKLDVIVCDSSTLPESSGTGTEVPITIWGKAVVDFDSLFEVGDVAKIDRVRVSSFKNSLQLSFVSSSRFKKAKPSWSSSQPLFTWVSEGSNLTGTEPLVTSIGEVVKKKSITLEVDVDDIFTKEMGFTEAKFVRVLAFLSEIRSVGRDDDADLWYPACPQCKKKMEVTEGEESACQRCGVQTPVKKIHG
ncbi:hypothetical protein GEMRC1_003092 [Eukaryota sp. GEM-RC1]